MPGTAVSEVKIDGVLHEYSTLEGVQEGRNRYTFKFKGSFC